MGDDVTPLTAHLLVCFTMYNFLFKPLYKLNHGSLPQWTLKKLQLIGMDWSWAGSSEHKKSCKASSFHWAYLLGTYPATGLNLRLSSRPFAKFYVDCVSIAFLSNCPRQYLKLGKLERWLSGCSGEFDQLLGSTQTHSAPQKRVTYDLGWQRGGFCTGWDESKPALS